MQSAIITPDIRKKINQITIQTKRLLKSALVGDNQSAVKGSGFSFNQIREYYVGDDIRYIDWRSSARMNTILVKEYIEERSRTIILAVDISASHFFGSHAESKHDVTATIAAILACVGHHGKDRVGLLLFSDQVERYIPPGLNQSHMYRIMQEIFSHKAQSRTTSLNSALRKIQSLSIKNGILFLVSDCIDETINPALLGAVSRSFDTIAIQCVDQFETEIPACGFIPMLDPETGDTLIVDCRTPEQTSLLLRKRLEDQERLFKQHRISVVSIDTSKEYIGSLIRFFRRRMHY